MTVLGGFAAGSLPALDGIAFVAQQKAGKMSGGQQAQLALTLALARRPRLLVLDEPMAMLDPLARHDFMATVLLAAAALLVVVEGVQLHHAYAAVTACRPAGSGACQQAVNNFSDDYSATAGIIAALLQAVPALIGAFAAGAFSMVFSWAYGPLLGMKGYGYSSLYSLFFDVRGIAFAAWTLAAFAIGVLAGVLIRRVLPGLRTRTSGRLLRSSASGGRRTAGPLACRP